MLVDDEKNSASKLNILYEMFFLVCADYVIYRHPSAILVSKCVSLSCHRQPFTPSLTSTLSEYIGDKLIIYHNQLCIRMSARQHLCLNALSYGDWLHCYTYTSVRCDFRFGPSARIDLCVCLFFFFVAWLRALHFTFPFSVYEFCRQLNKTQGFQSNNPISSDQYHIRQCYVCLTICNVNVHESLWLPSDLVLMKCNRCRPLTKFNQTVVYIVTQHIKIYLTKIGNSLHTNGFLCDVRL